MIDSSILDSFQTIPLAEMAKVRLMNRVDTKFVTSLYRLQELLKLMAPHYLLQRIDDRVNMPYYTRYYDTEDMQMYTEHERGKKNRQKIRVRLYEECGMLPFIEVKSKNNKGRTIKKRISMKNGLDLNLYRKFLRQHTTIPLSALRPQIENHFYRLTLVNREMTERVTIDTQLDFHNLSNGKRRSLHDVAIIEWKRDGRNCRSGLDNLLRQLRIHPGGFSKYCVGMALTTPELRQNRLKPRLREITRSSISTPS